MVLNWDMWRMVRWCKAVTVVVVGIQDAVNEERDYRRNTATPEPAQAPVRVSLIEDLVKLQ